MILAVPRGSSSPHFFIYNTFFLNFALPRNPPLIVLVGPSPSLFVRDVGLTLDSCSFPAMTFSFLSTPLFSFPFTCHSEITLVGVLGNSFAFPCAPVWFVKKSFARILFTGFFAPPNLFNVFGFFFSPPSSTLFYARCIAFFTPVSFPVCPLRGGFFKCLPLFTFRQFLNSLRLRSPDFCEESFPRTPPVILPASRDCTGLLGSF